jgi:hypothetical protein
MTDQVDLKHLGKLVEELGEGIAAAARCMIQGIDGLHPVTGKSNRKWLEDELADIEAGIYLVERWFKLDTPRMNERLSKKVELLQRWHAGASAFTQEEKPE